MSARPRTLWEKTRKFLNDVHLWLGLSSGIIVFLVCLSGTIYVFNTEIRESASPELFKVDYKEGMIAQTSAELISKVKETTGGQVLSVKIPADPARSWQIMVKPKGEGGGEKGRGESHGKSEGRKHDHGAMAGGKGAGEKAKGGAEKGKGGGGGRGPRGTTYYVNPYTGAILGDSKNSKTASSEFMGMMFSLHRWLLLDKIEEPLFGELPNRTLGSYISGTATIIFTLGVITGIVIWVPRRVKSWKQGLKIKTKGSWKRMNHDLHNTLGFYSCILLFIMGITGPQWSFPWYREALQKTLGTHKPHDAAPQRAATSELPVGKPERALTAEEYIMAANAVLKYEGDYTVSLPADSTAAVSVAKNKLGFFAPAASDKIMLDQYTAQTLEVDRFSDKPFNERVAGSIKALHVGDIYGMFSKILYFIACLIATSLPVTGTLIWINKMKKKPGKTGVRRAVKPQPDVV
ncbi:putative iron-regulated membrane protein [Arcticibacter pallidicorallinus]|uniref:Putative iron-regulated membrane protein n=1 Tax=Arcticibacter pallidicorallinus TaxID=1259464 RepID=A0A2T0U438_9SPHI|nr:PepSY-associated TM helix domain-containing protein [Arcticibacter pallidicorallinus]PRY52671.1 putative iron-regulated membrane protein [Arcticibacter pallidicorallinus]